MLQFLICFCLHKQYFSLYLFYKSSIITQCYLLKHQNQYYSLILYMLSKLTNNIYFEFLFGTFGIYFFAFISSVIHEKLLSKPYYSLSKQVEEQFTHPVGLVMFPYLAGWIAGSIVKCFSSQSSVKIPTKNLIYCGAAVFIATLTYNIAIIETSYPIVIMFKSCSILSVIVVGVFCSRVKDQHNKLGKNKLVVGGLVTVGILLFNLFSPRNGKQKTTTLYGFILLIISLVADGFLPDFQAEIKTVYKPKPVDLMAQTNKWVFILTVIYSILTQQFLPIIYFMVDHPWFSLDILLNASMSAIVQFFVYYLIQKFRQHIVPFVITIRKIFSVVISILWFNHSVGVMQWIGVVIVFASAVFDFIYQKYFSQPISSLGSKIEPEKTLMMQTEEHQRIHSTELQDQIDKALQGLQTFQNNDSDQNQNEEEPEVVK